MTEDRCPACEALMTELECYDCLTSDRASASANAIQRNQFKKKSHCSNGHAFTPKNTRIDRTKAAPAGYQVCRKCHNEHCARRRARLAAERAAS